jgi:hypothetical protein
MEKKEKKLEKKVKKKKKKIKKGKNWQKKKESPIAAFLIITST